MQYGFYNFIFAAILILAISGQFDLGLDHVLTNELLLKVNCRLEVNCRKNLGWLGQHQLVGQPKFFLNSLLATIHLYMISSIVTQNRLQLTAAKYLIDCRFLEYFSEQTVTFQYWAETFRLLQKLPELINRKWGLIWVFVPSSHNGLISDQKVQLITYTSLYN